ncbi:phosphate ABC transporter ATP-binding protein PstB [Aliiglaciecola sp. LCG003]|uniref:phosphate ABC transporter ATP-binding protein PstB n=1 Tax=Aliiglaciecola sp. LCG003 TaxID=3053655 RepID=UPI002574308C|nr:phosphate ABC transporter ATP-binding protein PstB [Aliiglaciecola sp. LCG003]WJG08635.1 phosphate ABC transporter ATP-binding protein PstB [Aliiglaciecola sp. LCG003]
MLKLFEHDTLDVHNLTKEQTAIDVRDLNLYFADKLVLNNINMSIPKHQVTAFIGQSGCGKSTLISCFNRMNDLLPNCTVNGVVNIGGRNIYHRKENVASLRTQVGMVFQKPNPFPMSIFDNVSYGLKLQGVTERRKLDDAVENTLKETGLWEEVRNRLFESALTLSGGQQQRLVIARALALKPEILLLDEPTSALDPLATLHIEELLNQLKLRHTVVIVTHNMQQAARVSDYTAFLHEGQIIEYADSDSIFTMPKMKQTEAYITGRYG